MIKTENWNRRKLSQYDKGYLKNLMANIIFNGEILNIFPKDQK